MPTTLRESTPTARKTHRCSLCLGTIQPGEKYQLFVNVYDGELYRWKECFPCKPVGKLLWSKDLCDSEGYNDDDAFEWARDCAEHPDWKWDDGERDLALAYLARRGYQPMVSGEAPEPLGEEASDD